MLTILHRYLPGMLLALAGLTGLALSSLFMNIASLSLAPPPASGAGAARTVATPGKLALTDYEVILKRDIFDPAGAGRETLFGSSTTDTATSAAPVHSRQDLTLIGTITDGAHSLALLMVGKESRVLRLDEDLAGGGTLVAVRRNEADIRFADGSVQTLQIPREGAKNARGPGNHIASAPARGAPGGQVRALGDNRFVVSRAEVEKARSNIGELLKQARMEPNLVNGQTNGFVVKMIQPNTLLAQLGLRVGDVVTRVNGVELNSPEKALQIFQQLREARRLSVDLTRNGKPLSLQYEVN